MKKMAMLIFVPGMLGMLMMAAEKMTWGNEGSFDQKHTPWQKILNDFVVLKGTQSYVKYGELKRNARNLEIYLKTISRVTESEFHKFSAEEKLAFLINAYNAYTLKLIVDNYPVQSVKEIGGWFNSPWKLKFFRLFGEKIHLDYLENELILKKFDDPRIHFALHGASMGGPSLSEEAYLGEKLNEQLEKAVKDFLGTIEKNRFIPEKERLELSKILEWHKEDFIKATGSVEKFVAPYLAEKEEERAFIIEGKVKVSFTDFDWSLNDMDKILPPKDYKE